MTKQPIRLCAVAANAADAAVIDALRGLDPEGMDHVLYLGEENADAAGNALFRVRTVRPDRRGERTEDDRFSGAARALECGLGMAAVQLEEIDHLTREVDQMPDKHPAIQDVQDYQHIMHITRDDLARLLRDEKITHVLLFDIPRSFHDICLTDAARALGLQVLILRQSVFPRQVFSMRDGHDLGHLVPRPEDAEAAPFPLSELGPDLSAANGTERQADAPSTGSGLRRVGQLLAHLAVNDPLKLLNPVYLTRLLRRMRTVPGPAAPWRDRYARFFHTDHLAYFEFITAADTTEPELDQPFVYFPLQPGPDVITSRQDGRYRDQLLALERLAELLPEGHLIHVQESPDQCGTPRSPLFFHRLARIGNARWIPGSADRRDMLAKSVAVATVSGNEGWEAVRAGKAVLCFGAPWWANAPGVTRYRPGLSFDAVLSRKADPGAVERFAGILRARSHSGNLRQPFPATDAEQIARTVLDLLSGRIPPTFDPAPSVPEESHP